MSNKHVTWVFVVQLEQVSHLDPRWCKCQSLHKLRWNGLQCKRLRFQPLCYRYYIHSHPSAIPSSARQLITLSARQSFLQMGLCQSFFKVLTWPAVFFFHAYYRYTVQKVQNYVLVQYASHDCSLWVDSLYHWDKKFKNIFFLQYIWSYMRKFFVKCLCLALLYFTIALKPLAQTFFHATLHLYKLTNNIYVFFAFRR
jgi:hypothetical protein